jgi:hypothetical protein
VQIPTGPPGDGPGDVPRPELSCDSQACRSALAEVANNRNRVLAKCAQVAATRGRMTLMAAIAGFWFTAAIALAAAAAGATATWFGIPAAIVLFIAAAIALAIAILFAIFAAIGAAQLAVQQGELGQERLRFMNSTQAVQDNCPASCWGDLSLPACSE